MKQTPIDSQLLEEVSEHMAAGCVIYVGTRDAKLMPESMLAMGASTDCEHKRLTVYLPEALAGATIANLEDNGQIAVSLTRPYDHKSIQVKGRSMRVRPATHADRALQGINRAGMVEQFALVGVPRALTRRITWWPSVAVEIDVEAVFTQTPGPRAGEPMVRA